MMMIMMMNVYGADIMTQSYCLSSPGSRYECRTAPDGCRPLDQADWLAWAIGPPVSGYETTSTVAILLLISPKADTVLILPSHRG